jgi:hypothetical protein
MQEIPLDPLFQRGKFAFISLHHPKKKTPPFEKGRTGGIFREAFLNG